MKEISITDLFCGAGGASIAAATTLRERGIGIGQHTALNHWGPALRTHQANHPEALHLQEDIRRVNPLDHSKPGELGLLLAGPDCTHHSRARGGKPRSTGQRALAWDVVRWARLTLPERILVENVPEFVEWGPVDDEGQPIKARRGEYFRDFLKAFRALGYSVDYRILCAAHYGDATTRRRLFVQARRGDMGPIRWPEARYRLPSEPEDLFGAPTARSAREIIDWNLSGESIFGRKKPLADATMARILEGLKRFVGGPFIVPQLSGARVRSIHEPMNTITATGTGNALVEPYMISFRGTGRNAARPRTLDEPIPTLTGGIHEYLVEPFLIPNFGEAPGQRPRTHSIDAPLPAVTSHGAGVLIEPFLLRYNDARRVQSVDDPLTTIDGSNRLGVVEPFLVSYYGNGKAHEIGEPLPTQTGHDRFGLVEGEWAAFEKGVAVVVDIRLRMLQPHELAAAHSFPADYQILGTKAERVKQIGNSWPVATARSLVGEML